jgi:geranylgeranyl diphosphate synthase type I
MPKTSIKTNNDTDLNQFSKQLAKYKQLIDQELHNVAENFASATAEQYGLMPAKVVDAFNSVLFNGGKRIRGAMAIASYQMFGGQDLAMITKAAVALEIFNTYILVADDIQDRSETRRGGLSAHVRLAKEHAEDRLKGQSEHYGEALAINSFLIAQHFASNLILSLNIDESLKIKVLNNINNCFIVTAHGQTMDIYSEAAETSDIDIVNSILEWKTAYYTFINPLQMGAILAKANNESLEQLGQYGLEAGKLFQITDDIIGTFGNAYETGKSELDDIREGKRTMLVVKALNACTKQDSYFLQSMLGNQNITRVEFEECKKIITECGALDETRMQAQKAGQKALEVLSINPNWNKQGVAFLQGAINYMLVRKA